jgi:hypothetical protein
MHADDNHPGLKKYRMARERDKERAILRNKIKTANPALTPTQIEQVMAGHVKAQQVSSVAVKGHNGQPHRVMVQKV